MPKKLRIEAVFKAIDRISAPTRRMQARIQRFSRGAKRALKKIDRVTSRIASGLGTGIKRGAFVAGAAVALLGVQLNRVASNLDSLAKRSRQIDFPIEDLQEWTFVAEQAGLSAQGFDKSMIKFVKTVGEARADTGSLVTLLRKTDKPFLKQIKNVDNVSDAFDLYIDKIRNTPNAMDKAALATAAFGRSAVDIISIANNSSEAIEKLRKEQRENGVVTLKQAALAEEYNDSVNSLKHSVTGFMQTALVPLMPLLTKGAKWLRAWVVANKDIISQKFLDFFKSIITNWKKIVDWAKKIAKGVLAFFALAAAVKVLVGAMELLNIVMAMNPVGLFIMGVAILVGILAAAFIWGKKLWKMFTELPGPIKALLALLAPLTGPLGLMIMIMVAIRVHLERIKKVAKSAFQIVRSVALFASDKIEKAWGPISKFFAGVWNGVIDAFESAINFIVNTGPISYLIAGVLLIKNNWDEITSFFRALWDLNASIFSAGVTTIVDGPIAWLLIVVDKIKNVWGQITSFFSGVWDSVSAVFDSAVSYIVNSGPVQWLLSVVDKIKVVFQPLIDFFMGVWDSIVGVFEKGVAAIGRALSPILGFFRQLQKAKDKLIGEEIGKIKLGGRIDVTGRDVPKAPGNVIPVDFRAGRRKDQSHTQDDMDFSHLGPGFSRQPDETQETGVQSGPQTMGTRTQSTRSLEETKTTDNLEITIRDETETGRAEVTKMPLRNKVKLERTGTF